MSAAQLFNILVYKHIPSGNVWILKTKIPPTKENLAVELRQRVRYFNSQAKATHKKSNLVLTAFLKDFPVHTEKDFEVIVVEENLANEDALIKMISTADYYRESGVIVLNERFR